MDSCFCGTDAGGGSEARFVAIATGWARCAPCFGCFFGAGGGGVSAGFVVFCGTAFGSIFGGFWFASSFLPGFTKVSGRLAGSGAFCSSLPGLAVLGTSARFFYGGGVTSSTLGFSGTFSIGLALAGFGTSATATTFSAYGGGYGYF